MEKFILPKFILAVVFVVALIVGFTVTATHFSEQQCLKRYDQFNAVYDQSSGCFVRVEGQYIPATLYKLENPELFE